MDFYLLLKTLVKTLAKNISIRYSQKLVDSAKTFATDAIKTASKGAIQKKAEPTGDLVGNKIADKITSHPKKSSDRPTELHSNESNDKIPKER